MVAVVEVAVVDNLADLLQAVVLVEDMEDKHLLRLQFLVLEEQLPFLLELQELVEP
jgi:hypothetical protein